MCTVIMQMCRAFHSSDLLPSPPLPSPPLPSPPSPSSIALPADAVLSYARALADQGIAVKCQHLYPMLASCSEAGQREGLVAALQTVRDLRLPIERLL